MSNNREFRQCGFAFLMALMREICRSKVSALPEGAAISLAGRPLSARAASRTLAPHPYRAAFPPPSRWARQAPPQ